MSYGTHTNLTADDEETPFAARTHRDFNAHMTPATVRLLESISATTRLCTDVHARWTQPCRKVHALDVTIETRACRRRYSLTIHGRFLRSPSVTKAS